MRTEGRRLAWRRSVSTRGCARTPDTTKSGYVGDTGWLSPATTLNGFSSQGKIGRGSPWWLDRLIRRCLCQPPPGLQACSVVVSLAWCSSGWFLGRVADRIFGGGLRSCAGTRPVISVSGPSGLRGHHVRQAPIGQSVPDDRGPSTQQFLHLLPWLQRRLRLPFHVLPVHQTATRPLAVQALRDTPPTSKQSSNSPISSSSWTSRRHIWTRSTTGGEGSLVHWMRVLSLAWLPPASFLSPCVLSLVT